MKQIAELSPNYVKIFKEASLPNGDELIKLVSPAVFLHTNPSSGKNIPLGASRLGGLPDLPANIDWPTWQEKLQSFIAQINLSEIPVFSDRNLLPKQGHLFFFYDSAQSTSGMYGFERESFSVFYTTAQVEKMHFNDIPENFQEKVFKPAQLLFSVGASVPSWEHSALEDIGLSFEERQEYAKMISQEAIPSSHQMLGHPHPMQYPVEWDCERARVGYWEVDKEKRKALQPLIREHLDEWILLLQVDEDIYTGMEWMGSGRIYYMIRRQDLKLQQFEQSWFVLQST